MPHEILERVSGETRKSLPLLAERVALNHAGVSPQPISGSVQEFERLRAAKLPGEALAAATAVAGELRAAYARLTGVTAAEIAITHHTAEGVNIIAQGFPWRPGDRVLTVSVEYPSNVYPWWNLKDRGVETVTVLEREGRVDVEEVVGALHSPFPASG